MATRNRFCDRCGVAIPSTESRYCPSCGAEVGSSGDIPAPTVQPPVRPQAERPSQTPPRRMPMDPRAPGSLQTSTYGGLSKRQIIGISGLILGILLVIILISNLTSSSGLPEVPAETVDLRRMLILHESNKLDAEEQYKGKLVRMQGSVKHIDDDYIEIIPYPSDQFQQSGARCNVLASERSKISDLVEQDLFKGRWGTRVTIRGKHKGFSGFMYTVAKIDRCQINPGPEPKPEPSASTQDTTAGAGTSRPIQKQVPSQLEREMAWRTTIESEKRAQPHGIQLGIVQDIMPNTKHVAEPQIVKYNNIPPTSGDHWPQWSECGFFEEELEDERIVHNLEHSGIVVSYNLATPEEIDQLRKIINDIGLAKTNGVTRAYTKIPEGTVALAAWGVSDNMEAIDKDRIETFFEAYAGKLGPEGNISCFNSGVMP